MVEAAKSIDDQEVYAAEKVYKHTLERAKEKLMQSYDLAITSAIRRGGNGLDLANELNAEKKRFLVLDSKGGNVPPNFNWDQLIQVLNGRT